MNDASSIDFDELIDVYIKPNSAKTIVEGYYGKRIKIKIACAPEKGKANKALIDFIAQKIKIPRTSIKILSGHKSSFKTISVKRQAGKNITSLLMEIQ